MVSDQDKSASLSQDTIYSELHSEMRYYRDKSMEMERWFSTIMFALFAGLISLASTDQGLNVISNLRLLIIIPVLVLNVLVNYWVFYTDRRYRELRRCVSSFELDLYSKVRRINKIKPHYLLVSLNITLLIVFIALIFLF